MTKHKVSKRSPPRKKIIKGNCGHCWNLDRYESLLYSTPETTIVQTTVDLTPEQAMKVYAYIKKLQGGAK